MSKQKNNKILEEVTLELVGEEAIPIVFYIKDKKKVSEFKIAKHIKRDIHETRSILYRLFEQNIANFVRKKDRKKGWYVCYWDLTPEKIQHEYDKIKKKRIDNLNQRLEREKSNEFYMCNNACARVDFDKAFNLNFKCFECGELLNPIDNKRTIEFLGEKLKELKTGIGMET
jgi:transcription initiation factor TFIIE subunit alpha